MTATPTTRTIGAAYPRAALRVAVRLFACALAVEHNAALRVLWRLPPRSPLMPLSVQSRPVGDVTVITCRGRIIEGPESAALQEHVGVQSHDRCIVLNLCEVDFIDSSGLGLLVRLLTRCRAAGGDLKLCAVPGRIR